MSIEDKELDEIESEKKELATQEQEVVANNTPLQSTSDIHTEFSNKMETVKQNLLVNAASKDDEFVEQVTSNIKEAALTLTKVEKSKADYQQQEVDYKSDKLTTEQKKEEHTQKEDKWTNAQKCREFHYNGVKPIMQFVGIETPMNLGMLYFLTILLVIPFFIATLIKGTFGALISGATDKDRAKSVKGFLWTMTAVLAVILIACIVYLILKWLGIDILANIKN